LSPKSAIARSLAMKCVTTGITTNINPTNTDGAAHSFSLNGRMASRTEITVTAPKPVAIPEARALNPGIFEGLNSDNNIGISIALELLCRLFAKECATCSSNPRLKSKPNKEPATKVTKIITKVIATRRIVVVMMTANRYAGRRARMTRNR